MKVIAYFGHFFLRQPRLPLVPIDTTEEPRNEKPDLGDLPGKTETGLCSYRD